jgi:glycosyltransferase involved in cell wall biosynthesis
MRVALLTPSYGPASGVVGRHVHVLATGAAGAGAEVDVFVHGTEPHDLPDNDPEVSVTSLWSPRGRGLSGALWSHLRREMRDFDLVHVHGESLVAPLLQMRDVSARVIFTPHLYATSQQRLRQLSQGHFARVDRRLLASADRVLCVSHSEALHVGRHAPHTAVEIVPNGVDTASIAGAVPFAVEPPVILTVDRLTQWAGIHRLISALPALAPGFQLVVVGRGRGRGSLAAHADYLGVADRVRFVGGIGDAELHRWLQTASVVASLKEESLWGGMLLSAACAGAPALASDISANREVAAMTGDRGIEFISRRASPFVIARALTRLADAGIRPATHRAPSWDEMALQIVSIYGGTIRHRRRARLHAVAS